MMRLGADVRNGDSHSSFHDYLEHKRLRIDLGTIQPPTQRGPGPANLSNTATNTQREQPLQTTSQTRSLKPEVGFRSLR